MLNLAFVVVVVFTPMLPLDAMRITSGTPLGPSVLPPAPKLIPLLLVVTVLPLLNPIQPM